MRRRRDGRLAMSFATTAESATWAIAALATFGVIVRPWRLPEAIWAVVGALALVALALLPWTSAVQAIGKGTDVYLFLIGMMLLAALARTEGLFDWLAAFAVRQARGSPRRLFGLVYAVGIVVTVFLSNDATAVVMTPAVYAAAKAAKAEPLPYLLICAFVASAASFVLPISNPANLVVFGSRMPTLLSWLAQFGLPSLLSIGATYIALRFTQRGFLQGEISRTIALPDLSTDGRLTACGIAITVPALLLASAFDWRLGFPTFVAGAATALVVSLRKRAAPWNVLRDISWDVLPLVAGLFVLVEGLDRTGVLGALSQWLHSASDTSVTATAFGAGIVAALGSNLANNLPVGLIAGSAATAAALPQHVIGALLIGVDLGPNLSVTGSLATILWLAALRREGLEVSAWTFLRIGLVVMPPALLLALGSYVLLQVR
jgi:arsenical pump membrane protein